MHTNKIKYEEKNRLKYLFKKQTGFQFSCIRI